MKSAIAEKSFSLLQIVAVSYVAGALLATIMFVLSLMGGSVMTLKAYFVLSFVMGSALLGAVLFLIVAFYVLFYTMYFIEWLWTEITT